MRKRIISLCLILAVILVSLPLSCPIWQVSAENTPMGTSDILSVDRVINDFNGIPTEGVATVGEHTVNIGIGKNDTDYKTNDYSALGGDFNTLTIENDELKSTMKANGKFYIASYISPVSLTRGNTMPSSESMALQFHIDFSDVTSYNYGEKIGFEVKIYFSTGRSSGAYAYCIPGETFLYIPDATEENPNPETRIFTTDGGVQAYHGSVWGYAGQSGTVVIPMDVWDTEKVNQFGGSLTIWDLYKYTQDYRHRSTVIFDSDSVKLSTDDAFTLDDICWMKKLSKSYDFKKDVQDFSDITTDNLGGWGNGVAWSKNTNMTITQDNVLSLKKTCDGAGRATTQFPIDNWNESYEAFAFDFDASEMVNEALLSGGKSHIRMLYAVGKTSTTTYAECYYSGIFKFVWENGDVVEATAASYGAPIPYGFKGQVIVPASAVSLSDEVKAGIAAGGQSMFSIELMSLTAEQKNTSVYLDNFVYYYNAQQLSDDKGTDFSKLDAPLYETATPIEEEIRTVEAFFKTSSNFTQSIVSTKFGSANYHGIFVEVSITATGQPFITIGSAEIQLGEVALNDGRWHHIAVTAQSDASALLCYIDGTLIKTVNIKGLTYPKYSAYLPLTVGSVLPAESMYYTVFDGSIANVRLWSSTRTKEEITENMMTSVGAEASGLVAEWMLSGTDFTTETTGKYPLKNFYWNIDSANELFAQYNRDAAKDEFTVLFLPDTQTIIKNFGDQVTDIFDWIIANKERLNVKAVVSLGDIIEYGTKEPDFVTLSEQYSRLTEAGIPSVLTIGDHDYNSFETRDSTYYDTYFNQDKLVENSEFGLGGLYDSNSLMNGYYYLEISEGVKYLIMNLEVQPRDEVIAWANDVIANNSDCRVIIATHKYMNRPDCERIATVSYKHGNSGEALWQKLVSQHKNIDMIVCGHAETSGYYAKYDEGINSNKVLQVNCDLQNTDQSYKTVGAILIGRFKNNGSAVSFNLYSAHHNLFIDSNCNDRSFSLGTMPGDAVAMCKDAYYSTLSEAIAAAENGEVITLLKDVCLSDTVLISKKTVIDTASYSVTVKGDAPIFAFANGYGMSVINGIFTADEDSVIADINSNGEIDINDVVYIRKKLLYADIDDSIYDINGDNGINILDLIRIKKLLAK